MFVFELEIRFGMIKIGHRPDRMKRSFGVALPAVLPEFILMDILMAVGAIGKPDTGEFLEFYAILYRNRMTFYARNILMHPRQRKVGRSMAEFRDWFEGFGSMTIRTQGRKGVLVIIGMTAQAIGPQSEIGELLGPDRFVCNEFILMTILTGSFCMCTGKNDT